jgi:hypothetical protein
MLMVGSTVLRSRTRTGRITLVVVFCSVCINRAVAPGLSDTKRACAASDGPGFHRVAPPAGYILPTGMIGLDALILVAQLSSYHTKEMTSYPSYCRLTRAE